MSGNKHQSVQVLFLRRSLSTYIAVSEKNPWFHVSAIQRYTTPASVPPISDATTQEKTSGRPSFSFSSTTLMGDLVLEYSAVPLLCFCHPILISHQFYCSSSFIETLRQVLIAPPKFSQPLKFTTILHFRSLPLHPNGIQGERLFMIGFQLLKPPEQIQFPFLLKSPVIPCIKRLIEVTVAQEN